MKKRRKASNSKRTTYLLLALAVILLLGSAIGSTRAAINYRSDNYVADIEIERIGVSLWENGDEISKRSYTERKLSDKGQWVETTGTLLEKMLLNPKTKDYDELMLNKRYPEVLQVQNSGGINEYVRVRIYRYWTEHW